MNRARTTLLFLLFALGADEARGDRAAQSSARAEDKANARALLPMLSAQDRDARLSAARAAPSVVDPWVLLSRLCDLAGRTERDDEKIAAAAAAASADIASNLGPEEISTHELGDDWIRRHLARFWLLARNRAASEAVRISALETAMALSRLLPEDPRLTRPFEELLRDPNAAIRRATLELLPATWIKQQAALLAGLAIGEADPDLALVAGQVLCEAGAAPTGDLAAGFLGRLRPLLADKKLSAAARAGAARCFFRDGNPESVKALAAAIAALPPYLSRALQKAAKEKPRE